MSGFLNALSASLILMALMSVGYFMGWRGWMGPSEKKFLSKYIVNIAVPCTCITGLLTNLSHDMLFQAGIMLISVVVGIVLTMLLAVALAQLLHIPHNRWGVFVVMTGLSNTLFIGLPVCTQLFGDACLPYVMIYYLGNTSFLQSVGIMLIQRSGTAEGTRTTVLGFFKNLLSKPPILGVIFAILMLILDLQLPSAVMKFAGYIGDTVSPWPSSTAGTLSGRWGSVTCACCPVCPPCWWCGWWYLPSYAGVSATCLGSPAWPCRFSL